MFDGKIFLDSLSSSVPSSKWKRQTVKGLGLSLPTNTSNIFCGQRTSSRWPLEILILKSKISIETNLKPKMITNEASSCSLAIKIWQIIERYVGSRSLDESASEYWVSSEQTQTSVFVYSGLLVYTNINGTLMD